MNTDQKQRNYLIYDAVAHEDALDASDRRELTPAEADEAHRFVDHMRARVLDEQRTRRTRFSDVARVRPSILAMTRDAILKRLGELFDNYPGAVFAHRDLTMMSEHDLRTALEDAESLVERIA